MIVNLFTKKDKIHEDSDSNVKSNITILYDKYSKQMDILKEKMKKKISVKSFDGIVMVGREKMHEIGFPTANIEVELNGLLRDGFYCTEVTIDEKVFNGLALTNQENKLVEVYIINFNKKIYGKKINVKFLNFIAFLKDFDEMEPKEQFKQNLEKAKNIFKNNKD